MRARREVLRLAALSVAAAAIIVAAKAHATGAYTIGWYTIDGGGGAMSGGTYTLTGTSGQADAGTLLGGSYRLGGGFWRGGVAPGTTAVGEQPGSGVPRIFHLAAPAPTPFRGSTTLTFSLPAAATVHLAVYDPTGALVRSIAQGEFAAGSHAERWDGRDAGGRTVARGIYFVRLEAGGKRQEQRILALR